MKISTRGSPCAERVFFRRVLGHKHEEQGCFGAAPRHLADPSTHRTYPMAIAL